MLKRILAISLALTASAPAAVAAPNYIFPVEAECKVKYVQAHHDYPANDIVLNKKSAVCHFLAPIDGVVDEVNRVDRWRKPPNNGIDRGGLSVSIIGKDGVRYYGSHLLKGSIPKSIQPGVSVTQGTILGQIGASGSARGTAPHLHFGISWPTEPNIWWVRRGVLTPYEYLNAWKAGKDLDPTAKLVKLKNYGKVPAEPKS